MEKRRRERINNSLNELKNLLLESRKKDVSIAISERMCFQAENTILKLDFHG
jgi:putative heme iron utilization protein